MLGDVVQEVTPSGDVINEWRSWEHLSLEEDTICFLEGRQAWTHQNTLHVPKAGDLRVSFRQPAPMGDSAAHDRARKTAAARLAGGGGAFACSGKEKERKRVRSPSVDGEKSSVGRQCGRH